MQTGVRKFLWALIILFITISDVTAQDIHFSQFYEAPLLRNPALAGLFSGDVRLQAIYRTQWQSVTVPYQTGSFNAEFKLPVGKSNDFITAGGEILYDKAGTINMSATHILPTLNYHKSLSDEKNMYLSLGFMGGLVQRKIDRSKITTNNQYDGNGYNPGLSDGETFSKTNYSYFDGTAGLSFNTQVGSNVDNNIVVGIAYHHFNKASKISFYSNPNYEMIPKWVFSGDVRMSATDYTYATFHFDYSKQGPYSEVIGGALYTWKLDDDLENPRHLISAGGFVRWKDAIIPVVKMESRPLAISVSYDANISQLSQASRGRGGFELSLTYQKFFEKYNSSREAVRCPRF